MKSDLKSVVGPVKAWIPDPKHFIPIINNATGISINNKYASFQYKKSYFLYVDINCPMMLMSFSSDTLAMVNFSFAFASEGLRTNKYKIMLKAKTSLKLIGKIGACSLSPFNKHKRKIWLIESWSAQLFGTYLHNFPKEKLQNNRPIRQIDLIASQSRTCEYIWRLHGSLNKVWTCRLF